MDVSVQADDEADTTSKCATSQKSSFENDQNLTEMLENSKKCSKTLPEKLKMMCKKLNSLDQSCINVQNNLSKLFGVIKGKEKLAALKKNEALAKKVKTYFDQWEKMSLNKIEMAESMYNLVDSKIQEVDKNIEIFDQNLKEISKSTNDQRFKSMTGVTSAFNGLDANLEDNQNEEITNNDASLNIEMPIDAYEPLYCVCNRVSFGKMVACDNPSCKIEWFHFECVGLKKQPKGEWYCGECLPKPNVSKLD